MYNTLLFADKFNIGNIQKIDFPTRRQTELKDKKKKEKKKARNMYIKIE